MSKGKEIESRFLAEGRALAEKGIILLNKSNSIAFVQDCQANDIEILGIDGFYLWNENIQPTMEHSIDFTSLFHPKVDNRYQVSLDFLRTKGEELMFEIIYKG
jgi:hypothetical protein